MPFIYFGSNNELKGLRQDVAELKSLLKGFIRMTQADFDALTAKVTEETTVEASAITLLEQLSALIKNNANNPALLQQVLDQIDAGKATLAAAVTANTPAA